MAYSTPYLEAFDFGIRFGTILKTGSNAKLPYGKLHVFGQDHTPNSTLCIDSRQTEDSPLNRRLSAQKLGSTPDLRESEIKECIDTDADMKDLAPSRSAGHAQVGDILGIIKSGLRQAENLSIDSESIPRQWRHQRKSSLTRSRFGETEKLHPIRTIGSGGEGKCFLLRRDRDQKLLVCKVIPRESWQPEKPLEIEILQDILPRHERILQLHDWIILSQGSQLYYDFYSGGDLGRVIDKYYEKYTPLPESFIWHVFLQLSEALAFIHYGYNSSSSGTRVKFSSWQQIIHRDIKPDNIFLRIAPYDPRRLEQHPYPDLVLGDFGMAALQNSNDLVGTEVWQPPEIPYSSPKGDVWALGAVIHAMIHEGNPPIGPMPSVFPATNRNWQRWKGQRSARRVTPVGDKYSSNLADCMLKALTRDMEMRMDSLELLDKVFHDEGRERVLRDEWTPLAQWTFF